MKKILALVSLLLVFVMTFTVAISVSALTPPYYALLGDANSDGLVNIRDASVVQKHVAAVETLEGNALVTADSDEDGRISIKDATVIQKYVASLEVDSPVGEEIEIPYETEPTTAPDETPTEEPTTAPTEPEEKMDTNITIYFTNNKKWTTVNAYFYNEDSQVEKAAWPGVKMILDSVNSYGEQIYKMDVDVSVYNRVVFNNGTSQTCNAPLSVISSGFYIRKDTPKKSMQLGIYPYGKEGFESYETVNLDYPDGYKKPIYIWTPMGYDPADTTKEYKVIYLLDGQNQFKNDSFDNGGWASYKTAASIQANGGDGVILVGIDNSRNRDSELTPDIGDVVPSYSQGFENGTGERFSNFVVDTVVPYIQNNYNVSHKPEDNAIVGSSSGGIEAFYIGMENMDVFGNIGALSPAYMLFDKTVWDGYFTKFDFTQTDKLPRIYNFNGGNDSLEKELLPYAEAMSGWLAELGYPEDKLTFVYEETYSHNEIAWRLILCDTIAWLFDL